MTASEQNRQMAALGRAVKKLTVALDQADAENADLRAEIAALRKAVRWLDLHRWELPSLMNPGAYAAYIRAMQEEK